jgi:hypothetical protein
MSIASEIIFLNEIKAAIRSAIIAKGVAVPAGRPAPPFAQSFLFPRNP